VQRGSQRSGIASSLDRLPFHRKIALGARNHPEKAISTYRAASPKKNHQRATALPAREQTASEKQAARAAASAHPTASGSLAVHFGAAALEWRSCCPRQGMLGPGSCCRPTDANRSPEAALSVASPSTPLVAWARLWRGVPAADDL